MLELLFVIGFFVMLLARRRVAARHSGSACGGDSGHVYWRIICPDDQTSAVAAAGRCGGVGYTGD